MTRDEFFEQLEGFFIDYNGYLKRDNLRDATYVKEQILAFIEEHKDLVEFKADI